MLHVEKDCLIFIRSYQTVSYTHLDVYKRQAFAFGGGKISTETSYEVKYELTDAFTTISITDIVSTASVVMDFKSGGKGVAVGKAVSYTHLDVYKRQVSILA